MSYNKELETDRQAKQDYDKRMKENAAERLEKNRLWNQAHRKSK